MRAAEWIDRVRAETDLKSDYAVAKALKISRAAVSHYRAEAHTMNDQVAIRLARLLGIDPIEVIADQNQERAREPEVKAFWKAMMGRVAGIALPMWYGVEAGLSAKGEACITVIRLAGEYILCQKMVFINHHKTCLVLR